MTLRGHHRQGGAGGCVCVYAGNGGNYMIQFHEGGAHEVRHLSGPGNPRNVHSKTKSSHLKEEKFTSRLEVMPEDIPRKLDVTSRDSLNFLQKGLWFLQCCKFKLLFS